MSITLHNAGLPICIGSQDFIDLIGKYGPWPQSGWKNRTAEAQTLADGLPKRNGVQFSLRVAFLAPFIELMWGPPTILKSATQPLNSADFAKVKGIIVFQNCGWSDASGHFDLWTGDTCLNNKDSCKYKYAKICEQISIWALAPKPILG
jgi:hypothetical protein